MTADPLTFRQSRLKSYVTCPRRTVLDAGWCGVEAELGSAFHAVAAEILRTLRATNQTQMPHQECIEVMREVMAKGPWVLPPGDGTAASAGYDMLVQMTLALADERWPNPTRFLAIEDRLSHPVVGPDGVARLATGTPDLVIVDPPHTLLIIDHKTGLAIPPTPRSTSEDETIRGLQYMSDHADFQLRDYGLLALKQWPRAQRVILRERNWRWLGPWREAVMTREDLEHYEPWLGELMMKLELALADPESELAKPRPGAHCTTRCPVARSCPIPQEQRGLGALATPADAMAEAERFVVIDALRKQMLKTLKSYHEATDEYIETNHGLLGWHEKTNGGREFTIKETATHV